MIDRLHPVSFLFGSDRIITRADLNAAAVFPNMAQNFFFSIHTIKPWDYTYLLADTQRFGSINPRFSQSPKNFGKNTGTFNPSGSKP